MYKLYYSPFSGSLPPHMALEKIGVEFELEKIDVRKGMHQTEDYLKLNRHGLVPLLKDGEQYIDQSAGILLHLADKHPESEMMPPPGDPKRAEAVSSLFYMSNTVHPSLKMAFYPERYSHGDSKGVLSNALEKAADLMRQLDQDLEDQSYLNGEQPYAADYYLTTMLNWLQVFKISLSDYPNLKAYKQRMDQLPEVAKALSKEAKEF